MLKNRWNANNFFPNLKDSNLLGLDREQDRLEINKESRVTIKGFVEETRIFAEDFGINFFLTFLFYIFPFFLSELTRPPLFSNIVLILAFPSPNRKVVTPGAAKAKKLTGFVVKGIIVF